MKTKVNSKTKGAAQRKTSGGQKSKEPKTDIENRDLNEDEQHQITNADKDDLAVGSENSSRSTGFTVEEEEEREKRRKAEDRHPEEPTK